MGVADADANLGAMLEHAEGYVGEIGFNWGVVGGIFGLGLVDRDVVRGGVSGGELFGFVYVVGSGTDGVVGLLCHVGG